MVHRGDRIAGGLALVRVVEVSRVTGVQPFGRRLAPRHGQKPEAMLEIRLVLTRRVGLPGSASSAHLAEWIPDTG